jgi:hypothetical protein
MIMVRSNCATNTAPSEIPVHADRSPRHMSAFARSSPVYFRLAAVADHHQGLRVPAVVHVCVCRVRSKATHLARGRKAGIESREPENTM